MRETFTSGSVGRASGNRCLYLEADRYAPADLFVMSLQGSCMNVTFLNRVVGLTLVMVCACNAVSGSDQTNSLISCGNVL